MYASILCCTFIPTPYTESGTNTKLFSMEHTFYCIHILAMLTPLTVKLGLEVQLFLLLVYLIIFD